MSITESSATALVRFTGLGIVCFNDKKQRGEIGIIRDDKHALAITIKQPRFKDGIEKDLVLYEPIAVYSSLPKSGVEIEIRTGPNAAVEGFQVYKAGSDFDRMESEDLNDYRWVVDMKELYGENLVKSNGNGRYPLSKLFINGGLFYVHNLKTDVFFEKVEKDAAGHEIARNDFGCIGETIGVKLEADEVSFSIKTGDEVQTQNLSRVNGLPFLIDIMNMNHGQDAVLSDMPDYHKYLTNSEGTVYELEPKKEPGTAGGGAVGIDVFCHPTGGGDFTSIEELE